jgi:RNA polymerase sigma factor (TIGR02999 family)
MTALDRTTGLLSAARQGDSDAFNREYAGVYQQLRQIARQRLSQNRPGETLNTTSLVHEAYLRLAGPAPVRPEDRSHLLALASRAMRFVLVDHARARRVQKRGGGQPDLRLDQIKVAGDEPVTADLVALDQALERLRGFSERQAQLVEYRFFGGLTFEEIAEVMGVSVRTAKRDWTRARTWLYACMTPAAE